MSERKMSMGNSMIPLDQISMTQQLFKSEYITMPENTLIPDISIFTKLNVKRLSEHAVIPTKAHGDAGWDLYYSGEERYFKHQTRMIFETGLAMEIPYGYVGLIWPRSGIACKNGIDRLAGVVDSTYRGEVKVCLYNSDNTYDTTINRGDRIAQILFQEVPEFELVEVDKLDNTERGGGGFGSSGR